MTILTTVKAKLSTLTSSTKQWAPHPDSNPGAGLFFRRRLLHLVYTVILVVFCVETFKVIEDYRCQPVGTTVSYHGDEHSHKEPLPYIQICSNYWANRTRLRELNVSEQLFEYLKSGFVGFNNYKGTRKPHDLAQVETEYRHFIAAYPVATPFDYRQFFTDVSRRKVIGYCRWEEQKYDCRRSLEPVFTSSGLCYLLRPEKAPSQSIPGPGGGLRILVQRDNDLEPDIFYNTGFDDGLHLSISGRWNPLLTKPIFVAMGKRAYIEVSRTQFNHLSEECTNLQKLNLFDEAYSQPGCMYECYVNNTLTMCGCTMFTYGVRLPHSRFCPPRVYRECIRPLTHHVQPSVLSECHKKCQDPCLDEEAITTTSFTTTDQNRVDTYNRVKNRTGKRIWKTENTAMLHIYYSRIRHRTITEHWTMTWHTVISNIGGQVSLWMGLSALTLASLVRQYLSKRKASLTSTSIVEEIEVAVEKNHPIFSVHK